MPETAMINPTVWAIAACRQFALRILDQELYPGEGDSSSGYLFGQRIAQLTNRRIHLTFDDGPHLVNTPRLLDDLKQFGVLATFFVKGKNLETPEAQALLKRIASEGHQIGNRTYSHPHLTGLGEEQIREEILRAEKLIGAADRGTKVFRPPLATTIPSLTRLCKSWATG